MGLMFQCTKNFLFCLTILTVCISLVPWISITKIENIVSLVPIVFSGWFSDLMKFLLFDFFHFLFLFFSFFVFLFSSDFLHFFPVINTHSKVGQSQKGASPDPYMVEVFTFKGLRLSKQPIFLQFTKRF